MKHAGPAALDRLEPLLDLLRRDTRLKEKSRGAFCRNGRAFLHFHEHGEEFYADVRLKDDFERFPATTSSERKALMQQVGRVLSDGKDAPVRSTPPKSAGKRN